MLWRRDRGDDWDARSVASSQLLQPSKSEYYAAGRASPAPSKMAGYDRYLQQGPQGSQQDHIEMTRFDADQMPLLTAQQTPGYFDPSRSNVSLPSYSPYGSPQMADSSPQIPPMPAMPPSQDYRQAQLHRPYPPSREPSGYAPPPQAPGGDVNMAGRGAFRGY